MADFSATIELNIRKRTGASMNAKLKVLKHLSSIFESVASGYEGEAKAELNGLCQHLENNADDAFEDKESVLQAARKALELFYAMQYQRGSQELGRVSRSLWEKLP